MANFGGPSGGLPAAGGSTIWSDRGEPLASLGPAGEGLVAATCVDGSWRGWTVSAVAS